LAAGRVCLQCRAFDSHFAGAGYYLNPDPAYQGSTGVKQNASKQKGIAHDGQSLFYVL